MSDAKNIDAYIFTNTFVQYYSSEPMRSSP